MTPFVVPDNPPQFLDLLRDRLAPWLTPATDPFGDHLAFLTAIAAMAQPFYSLIADRGDDPDDPSFVPGYGVLFDVDLCPLQYLPFLGQLNGTDPHALIGADDATARSIIRNEAGQKRGTPAAVIAAAQRALTGTKSVKLIERRRADGSASAYSFGVVVRPEELADLNQLKANIEAVKPAGLMYWILESDGTIWNAETSTYTADTETYDQKAG